MEMKGNNHCQRWLAFFAKTVYLLIEITLKRIDREDFKQNENTTKINERPQSRTAIYAISLIPKMRKDFNLLCKHM